MATPNNPKVLSYLEKLRSNHEWKFKDPKRNEPSRKGLLLSDEIQAFCENGLLIRDWKPGLLRPASYTMTIGPEYVDSRGKEGTLSNKKSFFYMEPNSIVYVSPREELNLPYYIAARFNLRVKWVYKGILLGTGPQVEPGFVGRLSCPLFNLTGQKVKIKLGDEFATIDFERTSAFCNDTELDTIKNGIAEGETLDELVVDSRKYLLFKQKEYKALRHLPEWQVVSSLSKMEKEVKTWRAVGIGIILSFFALALALLNFQNNLYREVLTLGKDAAATQTKVSTLEHTISNRSPNTPPSDSSGDLPNEKKGTAQKLSKPNP
jgi:deoxycytidine triphosphate deaminase